MIHHAPAYSTKAGIENDQGGGGGSKFNAKVRHGKQVLNDQAEGGLKKKGGRQAEIGREPSSLFN